MQLPHLWSLRFNIISFDPGLASPAVFAPLPHQDFCFTPFDLGMWAIFCDSLIGNKHTRDRHSNDALLCIHADSATALMDSRHLALALLAKLA